MTVGLPLMKSVFGLSTAMSATDAAIQKMEDI